MSINTLIFYLYFMMYMNKHYYKNPNYIIERLSLLYIFGKLNTPLQYGYEEIRTFLSTYFYREKKLENYYLELNSRNNKHIDLFYIDKFYKESEILRFNFIITPDKFYKMEIVITDKADNQIILSTQEQLTEFYDNISTSMSANSAKIVRKYCSIDQLKLITDRTKDSTLQQALLNDIYHIFYDISKEGVADICDI